MGIKSLVCILLLVGISMQQSLYGPDSKIIKLTTSNFEKRVLKGKELWFVEFYAPWCGHCKSLAPAWEKLAETFHGIVRVGAVDMTTDQSVGQPYDVKGFPTLKFFGVDKNKPIDYNGGRTAEEMAKFAMAQLRTVVSDRLKGKKTPGGAYSSSGRPSGSYKEKPQPGSGSDKDVVVLTDANFDELVLGSDDTWLVDFYAPWCGHCKKLEPEWNEAATKLQGEVKLGKVDATVQTNLASRFKVEGYPTIKVFPGGKKKDSSAENYNGARDASSIVSFATEKKEQTKPVLKVEQLLNSEIYNTYCSPKARGVCLVAFLPHILDSSPEKRNEYLKILDELSASNKGKPVTFLWSQGGDQFDMEETFALGSGYPSVIAISNSKKKYGVMRAAFTKSAVDSFLTGLMTGKEVLYNLVKEPPVKKATRWDGSAGKTSSDSDSGKGSDEL